MRRPETFFYAMYPAEFRSDALGLSREDKATYLLLLNRLCEVGGSLDCEDDEALSAAVELTLPEWKKAKPRILKHFEITRSGQIRHWMIDESLERKEARKKASKKANSEKARKAKERQRKGEIVPLKGSQ